MLSVAANCCILSVDTDSSTVPVDSIAFIHRLLVLAVVQNTNTVSVATDCCRLPVDTGCLTPSVDTGCCKEYGTVYCLSILSAILVFHTICLY